MSKDSQGPAPGPEVRPSEPTGHPSTGQDQHDATDSGRAHPSSIDGEQSARTPSGHEPSAGPLDAANAAVDKVAVALDKLFLGRREDRGELTAWVELGGWVAAAKLLRDETAFKVLSDLTAVDYLDRDPRFDLSIIVTSFEHHSCLRLKTMVSEESCSAPTLIGVWTGANWYEREVFDLFGIAFEKHPNMRRLLLPPDYHGHPLRKDYPVTGPATSAYR